MYFFMAITLGGLITGKSITQQGPQKSFSEKQGNSFSHNMWNTRASWAIKANNVSIA